MLSLTVRALFTVQTLTSVVPSLACVTMERVRTLMDVTGVTATQASG